MSYLSLSLIAKRHSSSLRIPLRGFLWYFQRECRKISNSEGAGQDGKRLKFFFFLFLLLNVTRALSFNLQPASGLLVEENNGHVLLKRVEVNENSAMVALV